jgi:anthranilate/para-aminobenzoate synthase component II
LEITAEDEQGQIMAFRHREHPTVGLQFHPESVLTPVGKSLLNNFLTLAMQHIDTASIS